MITNLKEYCEEGLCYLEGNEDISNAENPFIEVEDDSIEIPIAVCKCTICNKTHSVELYHEYKSEWYEKDELGYILMNHFDCSEK